MQQRLARYFEVGRHRPDSDNIQAIEGMRGIAVLLVFFVHYVSLYKPFLPSDEDGESAAFTDFTKWLHSFGNIGVDLFFILSGYLIYGTVLKKPQPYLHFVRRRIERLYPTFSLMFVLYLVLSWLFPTESKIPADFWQALLYLCQNYLMLPGVFAIEPMITVSWSLSSEIMFYLLIPVLVWLLALRHWSVPSRLWFFSGLTLVLLWYLPLSHNCSVMFIGGILLFDAMQLIPNRHYRPLLALLVVTALCLSQWLVFPPFGEMLLVLLWLCPLCYLAFTVRAVARPFCWVYLRWLGNMSYSYYLMHGLALNGCFLLARLWWPQPDGSILLFFIWLLPFFAITLISSALLFIWVEKPYSITPAQRG